MLEPTHKSAVEVINRDLLLSAIVLSWLFCFVLVTVYQPDDGDEKELGYKNYLVFKIGAVLADVVKATFTSS